MIPWHWNRTVRSRLPVFDLTAQTFDFATVLCFFHGAFLAAVAGAAFDTRRVDIDRFTQKGLQAADRIIQIASLATMVLRFDNDDKIIRNPPVPKVHDAP